MECHRERAATLVRECDDREALIFGAVMVEVSHCELSMLSGNG